MARSLESIDAEILSLKAERERELEIERGRIVEDSISGAMTDLSNGSMSLGGFISYVVDMRQIRQHDLAVASGLSDSSIHKFRHGELNPKADSLIAIAKALSIDPVLFLVAAKRL